MTILQDYLAIYARHNAAMNQRLFLSIDQVSDENYYHPVIASSRSIHDVLNHVLAADLTWIAELKGEKVEITSRYHTVCQTRDELRQMRCRIDAEITALVDKITEDDLATMIRYDDAEAGPMRWPFMLEVAHVFRHATHHRGQLTILLEAAGLEMPKIDDLYVPDDIVFEVPARSEETATAA